MKRSFICLVISIFLFSACNEKEKKYKVHYKPLNIAVYASGKVMPDKYDILKATQTARILKINTTQGDTVSVSERLIYLGSSDLKDQLSLLKQQVTIAKANAAANSSTLQKLHQQIELAKKQYQQDKEIAEKYSELYQTRAVSQKAKKEKQMQAENSLVNWQNLKQKLRIQESTLNQELIKAQSQLSTFRNNHSQQILRSSVSGIVFNINLNQGEMAQAGQPIMLVGSPKKFKLELLVDGRDIQKIEKGQSVMFKTDAFSDKQFQATITKINPVMQQDTRSFKVVAKVNSKETFYPKATVEANIVISKRDSVLMIPKSYLLPGDSVSVVENEESRKIKVQTGADNDQWVEIKSGLKEGDHILKKN